MGPNATAAHQQQLNEDNRQALVLFSIVIIFLISNVPRIALNIHEVHETHAYFYHECSDISDIYLQPADIGGNSQACCLAQLCLGAP